MEVNEDALAKNMLLNSVIRLRITMTLNKELDMFNPDRVESIIKAVCDEVTAVLIHKD